MEIKGYSVADLKIALASTDFWRTDPLPITRHRAASQIHNPRAEENDIVLLVCYEKGRIVGYLGILPDRIYLSGKPYKLGWLTGWWVDQRRAPAGVGTALLFRGLNAYDQQLGVSGSSKAAASVLMASRRFVSIDPLKGLDIEPRDRTGFKGGDEMIAHLNFEYVSSIDPETESLIYRHHRLDLCRKEKADLDWIMTYPWVLSAPLKDMAGKKYYFSSVANRFDYLAVKVFKESAELIGFFVLKVRNRKASLIFSYFEDAAVDALLAAVMHHARAMEVDVLGLHEARMAARLGPAGGGPGSVKPVSRGFLLTKPFAEKAWADCRLQGGDGDLAFY
jgi:hypothetical protein